MPKRPYEVIEHDINVAKARLTELEQEWEEHPMRQEHKKQWVISTAAHELALRRACLALVLPPGLLALLHDNKPEGHKLMSIVQTYEIEEGGSDGGRDYAWDIVITYQDRTVEYHADWWWDEGELQELDMDDAIKFKWATCHKAHFKCEAALWHTYMTGRADDEAATLGALALAASVVAGDSCRVAILDTWNRVWSK